jgi:RNA polymerase sigma-70 factor (ECF subfamily)
MMDETREPGAASGVYSSVGDDAEFETPEQLEAIRRGDADVFEQLARRHAPRLFRFALRLTGSRDEAEELVQDTLLRALPALTRFEGRARLSTYLLRALSNLWKNRLRARSRSRLVEWFRAAKRNPSRPDDDEAEFVPVDHAPSPLERLETSERNEQLRAAVSRLEPNRRLALLLREVEEMSYEEIARMTGVPVGTVRSRLARARDDLRALIGGPG